MAAKMAENAELTSVALSVATTLLTISRENAVLDNSAAD